MLLQTGDKFRAYDDSSGDYRMFWVDTLSFRMNGSYLKGDIVELEKWELESNRITFDVRKVDESKLDIPVNEIIVPVSLVGVDRDVSLDSHPNIEVSISDIKNDNKIFLILLRLRFNKTERIKIPLGDTDNLIEYRYEGSR